MYWLVEVEDARFMFSKDMATRIRSDDDKSFQPSLVSILMPAYNMSELHVHTNTRHQWKYSNSSHCMGMGPLSCVYSMLQDYSKIFAASCGSNVALSTWFPTWSVRQLDLVTLSLHACRHGCVLWLSCVLLSSLSWLPASMNGSNSSVDPTAVSNSGETLCTTRSRIYASGTCLVAACGKSAVAYS